jgi:hypothetical protein
LSNKERNSQTGEEIRIKTQSNSPLLATDENQKNLATQNNYPKKDLDSSLKNKETKHDQDNNKNISNNQSKKIKPLKN